MTIQNIPTSFHLKAPPISPPTYIPPTNSSIAGLIPLGSSLLSIALTACRSLYRTEGEMTDAARKNAKKNQRLIQKINNIQQGISVLFPLFIVFKNTEVIGKKTLKYDIFTGVRCIETLEHDHFGTACKLAGFITLIGGGVITALSIKRKMDLGVIPDPTILPNCQVSLNTKFNTGTQLALTTLLLATSSALTVEKIVPPRIGITTIIANLFDIIAQIQQSRENMVIRTKVNIADSKNHGPRNITILDFTNPNTPYLVHSNTSPDEISRINRLLTEGENSEPVTCSMIGMLVPQRIEDPPSIKIGVSDIEIAAKLNLGSLINTTKQQLCYICNTERPERVPFYSLCGNSQHAVCLCCWGNQLIIWSKNLSRVQNLLPLGITTATSPLKEALNSIEGISSQKAGLVVNLKSSIGLKPLKCAFCRGGKAEISLVGGSAIIHAGPSTNTLKVDVREVNLEIEGN